MLSSVSKAILCFLLIAQISYAQNYQSAESVEYDPSQNRFLISNGNNILARASDGTLSFFGSGSTSHGLEVLGDRVFGLSGNVVKGFDLDTEQEVMTLTISGASFLNGLTADGNTTLYATDFSGKRIYKIEVADIANPSFEVIVANTSKTPNGIIHDGDNNRLIFVTWGSSAEIRQIDLSDNSMSTILTTSLTNIDGIDDDSEGNYYISSWSPDRITKYDSNFENPITVTTPALNSPADIGYAQAIDTLAIPQGSTVDYVGFEMATATAELEVSEFALMVYPNPFIDQSWVQFKLEESAEVELDIYDVHGRRIKNLMTGHQPYGQHKVLLTGLELSRGVYMVVLKVNSSKLGNNYKVSTIELIAQ